MSTKRNHCFCVASHARRARFTIRQVVRVSRTLDLLSSNGFEGAADGLTESVLQVRVQESVITGHNILDSRNSPVIRICWVNVPSVIHLRGLAGPDNGGRVRKLHAAVESRLERAGLEPAGRVDVAPGANRDSCR